MRLLRRGGLEKCLSFDLSGDRRLQDLTDMNGVQIGIKG